MNDLGSSTARVVESASPRRRFTLLDGMILVAATAVGFAWIRYYLLTLRAFEVNPSVVSPPSIRLRVTSISACLATWTVAMTGLRLRRPRPRLRPLVQQPGAAACLAASLAITVQIFDAGLIALVDPTGTELYGSVIGISYLSPVAIGAVWLNLALSRRCRPERSWIDRAGRGLGVAWIVLHFVLMMIRP